MIIQIHKKCFYEVPNEMILQSECTTNNTPEVMTIPQNVGPEYEKLHIYCSVCHSPLLTYMQSQPTHGPTALTWWE
jgi:hypothetical protein